MCPSTCVCIYFRAFCVFKCWKSFFKYWLCRLLKESSPDHVLYCNYYIYLTRPLIIYCYTCCVWWRECHIFIASLVEKADILYVLLLCLVLVLKSPQSHFANPGHNASIATVTDLLLSHTKWNYIVTSNAPYRESLLKSANMLSACRSYLVTDIMIRYNMDLYHVSVQTGHITHIVSPWRCSVWLFQDHCIIYTTVYITQFCFPFMLFSALYILAHFSWERIVW